MKASANIPAPFAQAPADAVDVGTFSITGTTGNYPAGCVFSGDMYLCPGAGGTAANVTISSAGSAGAFLFTDTTAAFVEADAGQYINIVAANTIDNHPWNGAFPVLARHNATTLVVGNGAKAAQIPAFGGPTPPIEALAAASGYRLLAGAGGPIPASAAGSPEAIADDDAIIIALDAPDDGDFDDFTTTAIDPGDYFTLAPASIVLMNAIPTAGTAFTLGCNAEAASYTGGTAASFVIGSGTDEIDLTHTGGFVGVRAGAEVTIAGATTGLNNGDYVITEVTDDMITYVNADGVAEDFVAATSYVVNDCGDATLTGVSMEFNDGDLTTVLATHTGPTEDAAISDNGDGTMDIEHTGGFSPAYYGEWIALVNTNTPGNAVAFAEIIGATDDAVTVTFDGAIVEEVFAANTTYQVHKKISGLPDRATATKLGTISCAVLGGTSVEVVAGAAAALNTVDPSVIQTTMVRSALGGPPLSDNVNNNNVNILAGHGYVAFTVIE